MTGKRIIECDICEKTFELKESLLGTKLFGSIKVEFFSCPKCGYKYPFVLEDNEQLKFHMQLKTIQTDIQAKKRMGKEISPARLRQLDKLYEESKAHQAVLRDRYMKAVTEQLNKTDFETNS